MVNSRIVKKRKIISLFVLLSFVVSIYYLGTSSIFAGSYIGSAYEQKGLTQVPSALELKTDIQNYSDNVYHSTPSTTLPINPRMIAEWEPTKGSLIRYPLGISLSFVKLMAEESIVYVLIEPKLVEKATQQFKKSSIKMKNISFIEVISDSYWTRDYAPWWIVEGPTHNRRISIVDTKYYGPRVNDDDIPKVLADYFKKGTFFPLDITIQGGNVMTDGAGVGASTTKLYKQNPELTETSILKHAKDILGFDPYFLVKDPTGTYIEHIDCWSKFISPEKVLVKRVEPWNPQYKETEEAAEFFSKAKNKNGVPYTVIRVDTPNDEPYVNHLILNDRVFIPIIGNEGKRENDTALKQIRAAYGSKYRVYGVQGSKENPWLSTDSLHCRVNSIPDEAKISN